MATIKKHGPRNKVASPATGMALPDQTFSAVLLRDAIEGRTIQNKTKNKLRKVLFQFDKDKTTVIAPDDFYRILMEEGVELSDKVKARINKLFVNLKDNSLAYTTVLKALAFSSE